MRERVEFERSAFAILLAEPLEGFAGGLESTEMSVEDRVPDEDRGRWQPRAVCRMADSERACDHCNFCAAAGFECTERFLDRGYEDFYQDELDGIATDSSSVGSSMRVLYPRHSMRVE